jgi:epsilon-lactone hydrolase
VTGLAPRLMHAKSHVLLSLMRVWGLKRLLATPTMLRLLIALNRRTGPPRPTGWHVGGCRVETRHHEGRPVHRLAPADGKPAGHVLYLHGGAYVIDIVALHWSFAARLVEEGRFAVTVPLYPLGPEAGGARAVDFVLDAYGRLAAEVAPSDITIMGDSAGGGLSLVLAQMLAARGEPCPRQLVLLSPWLDLTMSNPAIPGVDRRDPFLSRAAALEAARLYAGPLALDDPRLSPLYGSMHGLPPITVFTGTRDILNPDVGRLKARIDAVGGQLDLREYRDMIHAWMLFPMPEAEEACAEILALVSREAAVEPAR